MHMTAQDELIAIKGVRDGLLISLSPTEKWQTVADQLAARIDERADFYAGADVTVQLGNRPVPKYELSSLKALLERRGLTLTMVLSNSDTTRESAASLDLKTKVDNQARRPPMPETPLSRSTDSMLGSAEETGTAGVLFRRTLRSGRTIHSKGHVVVIGDVNPGAKVIAGGDIIVWGKLRGTVHAGADDNEAAIVCALDMNPNQLRIAGYIVTSPPGKRENIVPEVAFIRDHHIIVEARG